MTAPAVTVEIAFGSGYSTPAASRTWTDVTAYLETEQGINIARGRTDELSQASPSTLALTLDNRDGRFTPERSGSPYYPNVKIGRPVRVTTTPDGGSASVRFVGYIDEWPVTWDGTDAYASVRITATSRTARLGQSAQLSDILTETIAVDDPAAHYPLDTLADRVGGASLRPTGTGAAVTFDGTGPDIDGRSAAQFSGGQYLVADLPAGATITGYGFFINTTTADVSIFEVGNSSSGAMGARMVYITAGGLLTVRNNNLAISSSTVVTDGETHHVFIVAGGSTDLYIDGVLEASSGSFGFSGSTELWLGRASDAAAVTFLAPPRFVGTLAHFALFTTAPTSNIGDHVAAGTTGFAGDTAGARLARYAAFADIPTAEQDFATGSTDIAHTDPAGRSVVDMLQAVAAADGGAIFDAKDGTLTYQGRGVRYQATAAITLSAAAQQIEADYVPKLDRAALLNTVEASNPAGTVAVRVVDAGSRDEYGDYSESLELLTDDETALHGAAWWRVNTRGEPTVRASSLSVDLLNLDAVDQAAILGLDVSSLLAASGLPSQAPATTADYFVEGYTETISATDYALTLNVTEAAAWLETVILDDRAELDLNTLAY